MSGNNIYQRLRAIFRLKVHEAPADKLNDIAT